MIRSLPPISVSASLEERAPSPLPPIGHDISRPSSTSTQSSNVPKHHHHHHHHHHHQQQSQQQHPSQMHGNNNVNLPGVSSLAGVGATHSPQLRSFSSVNQGVSYATPSPTPTSVGGQGSSPPICQNCQTSTTPLWRRDEMGSVLCNACGLFLKLHGRPRPISLKTDVIKSRNRVKNSGQALKKAAKALLNGHSRSTHGTPEPSVRRVSDKSIGSDRSNSPISRTTTPVVLAPPNIFDPTHIHQHHLAHSPSLPALNFPRHPSPGAVSAAGSDRHLEPPHTYDGLHHENSILKTRVSELEVINGLFKGRIQELERAESNARYDFDQSRARELELTKRMGDLERQLAELRRQTPPSSTPASGTKRRLDIEADLTVPGELSPPYAKRSRLSDVSPASVSPRTTA